MGCGLTGLCSDLVWVFLGISGLCNFEVKYMVTWRYGLSGQRSAEGLVEGLGATGTLFPTVLSTGRMSCRIAAFSRVSLSDFE